MNSTFNGFAWNGAGFNGSQGATPTPTPTPTARPTIIVPVLLDSGQPDPKTGTIY